MMILAQAAENITSLITVTAIGSGLSVFGLIKLLTALVPAVDKFFSGRNKRDDDDDNDKKNIAKLGRKIDRQGILLTVMARHMGIDASDYLRE